jgi:hypothetical protein
MTHVVGETYMPVHAKLHWTGEPRFAVSRPWAACAVACMVIPWILMIVGILANTAVTVSTDFKEAMKDLWSSAKNDGQQASSDSRNEDGTSGAQDSALDGMDANSIEAFEMNEII